MKLGNSIKLVMTNFNLFWKLLIYMFLCIGVAFVFLLPVMQQINNALDASGFLAEVSKFFNGVAFQGLYMFMEVVSKMILVFVSAISILAEYSIGALFYVLFIIFIVLPFLFHLSNISISECVYGYMTSLNKSSFVVSMLDKLGLSAGYSIIKTLLELPFYALFMWVIYSVSNITAVGTVMQVVLPLIWIVLFILLLDIKTTLLSGWPQAIVVFNVCAGNGIKRGFKSVKRNYLATLSSFAVVITVALAIIILFGAYALIPVVPLFSLITSVFGQVLFFESQGMDYYTSQTSIVNPRKLEQSDSIKKVKYKI